MTEQMLLFRPWQLLPTGPVVQNRYAEPWGVAICHPGGWGDSGGSTEQCLPTILTKDFRCACYVPRGKSPCECVGELLYRGSCRCCEWTGPAHDDENSAVGDAHDHCFPGWRDMPVILGPIPEDGNDKGKKSVESFIRRLENLGYPQGWIEYGGPILEQRRQGQTRAHTVNTGYGNYSICGEVLGCGVGRGKVDCEGIQNCLTGKCTPYGVE